MRRNSIFDKRMPTLLGLLFLSFSVGLITWFVGNITQPSGRAAEDETPKQIQISNITDNSFNISFVTDIKVPSAVAYGTTNEFGPIALDDRDKEAGTSTSRQLHYITLTNLSPDTKYYFAIRSGSKAFLNGDAPYEVTTAPVHEDSTSSQPQLKGTINLEDGTIPLEGIIYISTAASANTPNSQTLSALSQVDGSYTIPLNTMLSKDLGSYFEFKQDTVLSMIIRSTSAESTVSLLASQTNPVPLITLGKNYDFTINTTLPTDNLTASSSATASDSANMTQGPAITEFPTFNTEVASGPAILIPEDGQEFTDAQPQFEGTAIPNSSVEIIIESGENIVNTVQSDDLGNWIYKPDSPITPGEHIITLNARNSAGVMQTIKRTFVVHADGSQFNEPSIEPIDGQPTFTPTPTIDPATLTPTDTPTPSPTEELTPTPNLTLTMAASLSLTPASSISGELTVVPITSSDSSSQPTNAPVPASGNTPLFIVGFITVLSVAGSIMFFFL
jgi:Purple acid Phosphatase, N-terminal domain/Bacterial Ig-like domain